MRVLALLAVLAFSIGAAQAQPYGSNLPTNWTVSLPGGPGTTYATAYEIHTRAQLLKMSDMVRTNVPANSNTAYYKLMENIDMNDTSDGGGVCSTWQWSFTGAPATGGGTGFMPIGDGNAAPRFAGSFDGNNKVISNLYIVSATNIGNSYGIGLFGAINSTSAGTNADDNTLIIKNLGIDNGEFAGGYNHVGALIGRWMQSDRFFSI